MTFQRAKEERGSVTKTETERAVSQDLCSSVEEHSQYAATPQRKSQGNNSPASLFSFPYLLLLLLIGCSQLEVRRSLYCADQFALGHRAGGRNGESGLFKVSVHPPRFKSNRKGHNCKQKSPAVSQFCLRRTKETLLTITVARGRKPRWGQRLPHVCE